MLPFCDAAFLFDTTQNFAMLPNAIFNTWQGTQTLTQSQPCKRAKNADAQAHPLPSGRNS